MTTYRVKKETFYTGPGTKRIKEIMTLQKRVFGLFWKSVKIYDMFDMSGECSLPYIEATLSNVLHTYHPQTLDEASEAVRWLRQGKRYVLVQDIANIHFGYLKRTYWEDWFGFDSIKTAFVGTHPHDITEMLFELNRKKLKPDVAIYEMNKEKDAFSKIGRIVKKNN